MDFLSNLLADVQVQNVIITILGSVITFFVARASAAFTAATGIRAAQGTQDMIAKAITTGAVSAFAYGLKAGTDTFKAHVINHLSQGNPEMFAKLSPFPDALDNLIARYASDALNKIREPK